MFSGRLVIYYQAIFFLLLIELIWKINNYFIFLPEINNLLTSAWISRFALDLIFFVCTLRQQFLWIKETFLWIKERFVNLKRFFLSWICNLLSSDIFSLTYLIIWKINNYFIFLSEINNLHTSVWISRIALDFIFVVCTMRQQFLWIKETFLWI